MEGCGCNLPTLRRTCSGADEQVAAGANVGAVGSAGAGPASGPRSAVLTASAAPTVAVIPHGNKGGVGLGR